MRKTNWRLVITGLALIILAMVFFVGMATMTGRSNDPAGMMQIVGQVSGVAAGLGLVLAIFGVVGRRTA
jgi:hypothetical protein